MNGASFTVILELHTYTGCDIINESSAVVEMVRRLAAIDMGRKVGGCCAPIWATGEDWKPKQLHGTSTDVESLVIASLIITLEGNR